MGKFCVVRVKPFGDNARTFTMIDIIVNEGREETADVNLSVISVEMERKLRTSIDVSYKGCDEKPKKFSIKSEVSDFL